MKKIVAPATWLILLLAGMSQLSETVYTPSLPAIAQALHTSVALVEYTLTIYLFGFALGTLFWGKISDQLGRKPCVLAGLVIYILGCVGCYCSHSITELMISRLLQSFGASIGSVLAQAICRDTFHGPALGKIYSSLGSALALFPLIGPIIGGLIAEHYGWVDIFLFLILFGLFLTLAVSLRLPETHHKDHRQPVSIAKVTWDLLHDKKVIALGLIVAGCNGITFSYYAEGSFYLIKLLGLSPSHYGFTFVILAAGTLFGGIASRKLQKTRTPECVIDYGLSITFLGSILFSGFMLLHLLWPMPKEFLIGITIFSQISLSIGICITTFNALATALVDYKWCVGTASSLFGFFYYIGISLFTLGMGSLHNGTLLPMPLYFLVISGFMLLVRRVMVQHASIK
jgi:Bcr/CflA subfamily drug resistance transporter